MTSLTIIVTAGAPIATLHVLFLSIFGKPTVIEEEDPQTGEIKEVLWFEEMDCLAINVIFQYFVLFVSMGILLTYTLKGGGCMKEKRGGKDADFHFIYMHSIIKHFFFSTILSDLLFSIDLTLLLVVGKYFSH